MVGAGAAMVTAVASDASDFLGEMHISLRICVHGVSPALSLFITRVLRPSPLLMDVSQDPVNATLFLLLCVLLNLPVICVVLFHLLIRVELHSR